MAKQPRGHNCLLRAPGYGSRWVRAEVLDFGVSIVSTVDDRARARSAFYPQHVTSSSFSMTAIFTTYRDVTSFNQWMQGFMEDVSDGGKGEGYMHVSCKARRFERVAVPEGPLTYGDSWDSGAYERTMTFVGASDPVDFDLRATVRGTSYFYLPDEGKKSRFFYPLGEQLEGAADLEGSTFDNYDGEGPDDDGDDGGPTNNAIWLREYQAGIRSGAIPASVSFEEWLDLIGVT